MQTEILSHLPTPRLDFRLLSVDQAPLSMEARIESFLQLKKWDIFAPETSAEVINIADEVKMCEWRINRIKQRESLFYSIFSRDNNRRYLGNVSLTKCDWNKKKAMLGFWIRTSETGKGYATEAAKILLNYGVNKLGLNIYSMHAAENQNSQAVLLRLGFQPIHTDQACQHLPNDSVVDEIYYELKCHNDGSSGGI